MPRRSMIRGSHWASEMWGFAVELDVANGRWLRVLRPSVAGLASLTTSRQERGGVVGWTDGDHGGLP